MFGTWFTHKGIPANSKKGFRTGSDKNPCETVYINRFNRDNSEDVPKTLKLTKKKDEK